VAIPRKPIQTVRQFAREHALFRPGPLLVAASGGTDSTALLLVLAELADEHGLVLHAAHFDHRARPRAAARDAQYVADLAARCGAQLRIGRADAKPASEDAARTARYAFLRRVAAEIGATAIATGHTRDDQAETVLLHLTRGAGLAGLAGMRPERDGIVRPLLALGRPDTALMCAAAGITPREDPTNRSLRFARNRIRRRVMPELAKLNPEITSAIARLAEAASNVVEVSADHAAVILDAATAKNGPESDEETVALDRLPSHADARGGALALWWERRTGRQLAARHRAALAQLAASTDGSRSLDLPGGRALREYATLRFVAREPGMGATDKKLLRDGPITLERGGSVEWHGWRFALDMEIDGAAELAHLDTDRVIVRGRRPGDRMNGPRGAKVQDLFSDAKVPARERDDWPLVTADEAVLWIPGITPPPRAGRTALQARRLGEDPLGMTLGNREQVASLREVRPPGEERGRPRT
jgi:tRNA(Ile)-lysidine synthetase-like protein